jgi:hypothetical protein
MEAPSLTLLIGPVALLAFLSVIYCFRHKPIGRTAVRVIRLSAAVFLPTLLLGGLGLLLDFVYCVCHFGEWPPFLLVVPGSLVGLAAGLAYQGYLSIRRWHRPFLWKDEAKEPVKISGFLE